MKVLALAGDAGGVRAVSPVLRKLAAQPGITLQVQAYAAAVEIWRREGWPIAPVDIAAVASCDRVLLGTSWQPEQWELEAIATAAKAGIRNVSVLDSWVNYRVRFLNQRREFVLPDAIAVMDESARTEMLAEGFPAERLVVTGHPGFGELEEYSSAEAQATARKRLREALNLKPEASIFLFASQPISQMADGASWGYDERQVLADIIASLDATTEDHEAVLLVKRHPRESGELALSKTASLIIRVVDDALGDYRELVAASDFVLGMNSNLLLEACLLGKHVVSYQPGLLRPDPLPSNRLGWSRAVTGRDALAPALAEEIFDDSRRRSREELLRSLPRPSGAAERVMRLLLDSHGCNS